MRHRIIAALLTAAVFCTSVPAAAFAEEDISAEPAKEYKLNTVIEQDGIRYSIYSVEPLRFQVKKCLSDMDEIEIPESVDDIIVDKIGDYSFEHNENIISVKLPDTIRTIGNHAFYCCENLKNVNIPENLESIEYLGFSNCNSISGMKLNRGLKSVGSAAFQMCESVNALSIPGGVEVFRDHTTHFMYDLYTLRLCSGVKEIEATAAENNYFQKRVMIPPSVTKIGDHSIGYLFQKGEYQGVNDAKIYGVKGSAAEKYAKENGLGFVEFDFMYGDINADGDVNANDACLVLAEYARSVTDDMKSSFDEAQTARADVNDDLEVNAVDACVILSYYAYISSGGERTPEEFFFLS